MPINWKMRSLYFWSLLILISQLISSAGCFYGQHKLQADITARTAANARLEPKLRDIKCEQINKEVVLEVMKGSVIDEKSLAEVLFYFGMFSVWTAVLALISLVVIRQKHAASSQV